MEEENKKEVEEDILTKLTMPGQSLREETIQKGQEAVANQGESPVRLGATEEVKEEKVQEEESPAMTYTPEEVKEVVEEEKPAEDILTKLTMPGQEPHQEPAQEAEEKTQPAGTMNGLDVGKVQKLAESIFNSDYSEKKKKT